MFHSRASKAVSTSAMASVSTDEAMESRGLDQEWLKMDELGEPVWADRFVNEYLRAIALHNDKGHDGDDEYDGR